MNETEYIGSVVAAEMLGCCALASPEMASAANISSAATTIAVMR